MPILTGVQTCEIVHPSSLLWDKMTDVHIKLQAAGEFNRWTESSALVELQLKHMNTLMKD